MRIKQQIGKRAVCPACGHGQLLVQATITVPLLDITKVPATQARSDAVVSVGAAAVCEQCEWTGPADDVPMVNPHCSTGKALSDVRCIASELLEAEAKLKATLKPLSDSDRVLVSKPLRYAMQRCSELLVAACKDKELSDEVS